MSENKKTYKKPSMKMYELKQQSLLLVGSNNGDGTIPDNDDYGNGGDPLCF